MAVVYREVRVETGHFARIHIFPVRPVSRGRREKNKPTRATQERLNRKNAANRVTDLINLNFTKNSWVLRLNYCAFREKYGRNPTEDEIQRELHNFMRRLKRKYDKRGLELKWVVCTEVGVRGGLCHHHIVLSEGLELEEIKKAWKCGGVGWSEERGSKLYFDERGAYDLAAYMVKDKYTYKSYSCSRNLKRPQERREIFENDHRISQKSFNAIMSNDIYTLHKLYPGWSIASLPDVEFDIDYNTGEVRGSTMSSFLTLYLYRSEGLSAKVSKIRQAERKKEQVISGG